MSRQITPPGLMAACLILLLLSPHSGVAASGSQNVASACATLEYMAKMLTINTLLPAHRDSYSELHDMNRQLQELNELVCQRVVLTRDTRADSRYRNGNRVSADLYYDPWYFPNGQVFLSRPGDDVTVYYPNGQPLAYHWMRGGQALFWANGRLATNAFRTFDVTWYYPDGNIITYESGYQGGRWFYPIPRLDGGPGQQLIASDWGIEDKKFNYLNFESDGYLTISRERIRRKLVLDDLDLLDVPGVLLLVTRLYGVKDRASLFTPPDASITDAPF